MHGEGPLYGDAIKLNFLLSGKDPVALDHCACGIVGIAPYTISHIVSAEKSGIGKFEYEVKGEIPHVEGFTLPNH